MAETSNSAKQDQYNVILVDGLCVLCNGFTRFVILRDPSIKFKFAAFQSDAGRAASLRFGLPSINDNTAPIDMKLESIILIEGDKHYVKSAAALRIFKNLKGLWPVLYVWIIVPKFIRDWMYDIIARNRYKWFGRLNACPIPDEKDNEHFLR